MPRRRQFHQRVAGAIQSMAPGTIGGRVSNASPVRAAPQRGSGVVASPPAAESGLDFSAGQIWTQNGGSYDDIGGIYFPNADSEGHQHVFVGKQVGTGGHPISSAKFFNHTDAQTLTIQACRMRVMDPDTGAIAHGEIGSDIVIAAGDDYEITTGDMWWDRVDTGFTNTSGDLKRTAAGPYIQVVDFSVTWS